MNFITALKFLTTIPLPGGRGDSAGEIGRSVVYFPVVGLIIGLILAGLNWLLGLFLPVALVNALLIAALVAITGALHLDGFMDTCDGIGGHKSVEDRWKVMQDSRVGAFGVVGVILLLLVKFTALSSVPAALVPAALVIMPVIGRWAMVYALFVYPYARPQGLGQAIRQAINWQRFSVATAITLVIVLSAAWLADISYFYLAGLAILLAIWVILIIMAAYLKKMFAGLTGDTYGAINEISELSTLIIIVIIGGSQWFI